MNSAILCAVMLTVAIDHGYEEMPGGGIRYVIQIEPEMLNVLRRGDPLGSSIPPEVRGRIQAFQIVSNYGPLSKEIPPLPETPPDPALLSPGISKSPGIDDPRVGVPSQPDMPWLTLPAMEPPQESPPGLLPNSDMVVQTSGTEPTASLAGPSGMLEKEEKKDSEKPKYSSTDPWFLLVLASVVAAGSSSGMLYFGWLAFDYRSRYLGLLRDSMKTGDSWLDDPLDTASHDPIASEPFETPVSSTRVDKRQADAPVTEDPAWQDVGAESEDVLDDWLNENEDQRRGSRRNRKKSR